MEIELKNGQKLILEVTPLLLEYIEDYEGGLEQLKKDAQSEKSMYATNHIVYSMIASNYDEPLTYRQAVRLVKLEDVERIVDFVVKNTPNTEKSISAKETKHRM